MIDFPRAEFEKRAELAKRAMAKAGVHALFLTTEADLRYFSGFRTLFWQSQTRAWFLILPQHGDPIAVIPQIGESLMSQTWVKDIRVFTAPAPDDDSEEGGAALNLLAAALNNFSVIGLPMGAETRLGMPLAGFEYLRRRLKNAKFIDASLIIRRLRQIKSPLEIEKIESAAAAASRAFARAGELFHRGQSLKDAFLAFKTALLRAGAEEVPYLVGGIGRGGYKDVISPPTTQVLEKGDVLMLDTGTTVAGYFCDFDRNFAVGCADDAANRAYETLYEATEAGLVKAKPGARYCDIYNAMANVIADNGYHNGSDVGRLGHGLGMQLTETPSVTSWEETVLSANMVLTLEPSLTIAEGKMMVHEENIVITENGCRLLSERAKPHLPVLGV